MDNRQRALVRVRVRVRVGVRFRVWARACRQAEGESECDMRWKALEPTW